MITVSAAAKASDFCNDFWSTCSMYEYVLCMNMGRSRSRTPSPGMHFLQQLCTHILSILISFFLLQRGIVDVIEAGLANECTDGTRNVTGKEIEMETGIGRDFAEKGKEMTPEPDLVTDGLMAGRQGVGDREAGHLFATVGLIVDLNHIQRELQFSFSLNTN